MQSLLKRKMNHQRVGLHRAPARHQSGGIVALMVSGLILAMPGQVWAEKADRTKPIEIDAASSTADLANNVQLLEGRVVLSQGTMRITAEKMRLKRDAQDNIFAELFGAPGGQISFREKREGFNDFMEGTADRAEFDDKTNTIKLFNNARLKNGGDVLTGEYIYYNSVTEVIQALGRIPDANAAGKPSPAAATSRVKIVIQPRGESSNDASAAKAGVPKTNATEPPKKAP
jgi:lipopolysaccharide export system protein LptA